MNVAFRGKLCERSMNKEYSSDSFLIVQERVCFFLRICQTLDSGQRCLKNLAISGTGIILFKRFDFIIRFDDLVD